VRGNRAIFTAATATLGVAASLIASDGNRLSNWLLLGGAGLLMASEDVCRDIELEIRILKRNADHLDLKQIRTDALSMHHPRRLAAAIAAAIGILVAGGAVRAVEMPTKQSRQYVCLGSHQSQRFVCRPTRIVAP